MSSKRRAWTTSEVTDLERMYGKVPVKEIARAIGRTVPSIENKARRQGLASNLSGNQFTSNAVDHRVDRAIEEQKQGNNLDALWTAIYAFQEASLALDTEVDEADFNIETDKPIAVAFLADAHIGAITCKYEDLVKRFELMEKTEGLYIASVGDTIDNYLPTKHPAGMFSQLIPPEIQKQLVENLYGRMKGRWIGVVQGCFLEGTKVIMANGRENPIEQVTVGDFVLSEGSKQKVMKTYKNQWNGKIVALNIMGVTQTIHTTDNHKFWCRRRTDKRHSDGNWGTRTVSPTENWVEAGDLRERDFVALPRIKGEIKPKFTVDEMNVFGWWLAEGSFAGNATVFSFGEKDEPDAKRIETHFKSMGFNTHLKKREKRHTVPLAVKSWEVTNLFHSLFGKYCDGKFIPEEFLYYPEEHQRQLLKGLFDGDGHRRNNSGEETAWTTTSPHLQSQIRQILIRLGYSTSTSYYERDGKKPYWVLTWRETPSRQQHILDEDYVWVPVKSVETYVYDGEVYNFEVKNTHTYKVSGVKVLNCHDDFSKQTDDFDWTKYLAKQLGCPNLGFGGFINLRVGEVGYRLCLRHKFRGNSAKNLTATVKRMREELGDFSVGIVAHHHQAAVEQVVHTDGIDRIFIRPGSFKGADRYAKSLGYKDTGAYIPTVVFFPKKRMMIPFLHLEQAAEFLKSVR